ncbi:MAG TPA: hypothetical protein VF240_13770, partial [Pyrinomonadaceae bacterium]
MSARTLFVVVLALLATAGPFDLKPALHSPLELKAAAAHRRGAEDAEGAQRVPAAQPTPTPSPTEAPDDEVERVDVDLASVLLTAVDRERRFVTTLRREDIRL